MYIESSRKMGKKLLKVVSPWGVGLRKVWEGGCGVEERNFTFHLISFYPELFAISTYFIIFLKS